MIVYSSSDRFSLKVDGVEFLLSPLTQKQKLDVLSVGQINNGEQGKSLDMAMKTIQYCLKGVKGIERPDGSEFEIKMDKGVASEESIDTLMNCQVSDTVMSACMQFLNGIPDKIVNPVSGEAMDGVEFSYSGGTSEKK